ncbi:MAG: BACON domain-containing protein [Bacteroidales bacterium]|nr:BACON domain-containing protein [Bacteroidales bacterium]
MNLKRIALALLAAGFFFTACEEEDLGLPKISVDPNELSFEAGAATATVNLTTTRSWYITNKQQLPDWIGLSVEKGNAAAAPQTITISVLANPGNDRTGEVIFSIGLAKASVSITQKGELGPVNLGSGTKDDPFTVEGVIDYVKELGSDVQSPSPVFVKGIVTNVTTTYEASGNYGNGTFYIADYEEGEKFYCFQVLYLGNRKWKSGEPEVMEGDEVIICSPVVLFKGNTPETVGKGAGFLYSLNGKTEGGEPAAPGTAKGQGTLEDPFNPAGAAAYTIALGKDVQSPDKIYIKGKVSNVATTFADSGNYGNASFTIVDAEDETGSFYVFQTYYLGNRKWKSGDQEIKEGDIVIVHGPVIYYQGNTPETVGKGASYIYSLNGNTGGNTTPPDDPGTPSGSGTLDSPFNVAAAINAVKNLTWTSKEVYDKVGPYYVKGVVSTVDEAYAASFGNGTFHIKDAGGSAEFYVFRALYLGNKKWVEGNTQIKVGDEVIIYAELMNYHGDTPETVQNGGYLYSLNGQTEAGQTPPDTPGTSGEPSGNGTLESPYNAAGAIEYIKGANYSADAQVYVAGKISSVKYTFDVAHGTATFDISDDGKTSSTQFTCYGVYFLQNKPWEEGWANVKVGDDVIIYGKVLFYEQSSVYETSSKNAYIYSLNGNTEAGAAVDPGTGGEPSGDQVVIDFTAQGYENAADFASLTVNGVTVTGTSGSNTKNGPKYYTTGKAVRFYAGNDFTVSASKTITKIELAFGSDDKDNAIVATPGTYSEPVWTGSASSVKFTVDGSTGHRRVAKITVSF